MLGTKRSKGCSGLYWGLFLFFVGLLLWGLFWGIPEIADVTTNIPVAYALDKTSALDFPSALFFTYVVMGWACVAIAILGLVTLVGWRGTKKEIRKDFGKARHIHPIKGGKNHRHALKGWW